MEWWEKEASFEANYHAGRCAKNLWKYIPHKFKEAIEDAIVDQDGYWIGLAEGYVFEDAGQDSRIIHEYNLVDLKAAISTIRKVDNVL